MRTRLLLTVAALAVAAATIFGIASSGALASSAQTYLVLYKQSAVPADAAAAIQSAGGALVYSYGQIGVAVARSDSSTFASTLSGNNKIDGVSATGRVRNPGHGRPERLRRFEHPARQRARGQQRQSHGIAVGHDADPYARGARDHRRQPVGPRR